MKALLIVVFMAALIGCQAEVTEEKQRQCRQTASYAYMVMEIRQSGMSREQMADKLKENAGWVAMAMLAHGEPLQETADAKRAATWKYSDDWRAYCLTGRWPESRP